VHCTDGELARIAETGSSIAHCPTSQLFLGSGTMPWLRTTSAGVTVALGSDIGAGDEWLIPRVLNDCYKAHISEPGTASAALHPAELLYTATLAGARALDMEARFGNFDLGKDADFVVVEPDRWEPLAHALAYGTPDDAGAERTVFRLLMGLREPAIAEVWVQGRRAQLPR
jgi:guanine deaminase